MHKFCLSVDLGSEGDPSALSLIERVERVQEPPRPIKSHLWKDDPANIVSELHLVFMRNLPLKMRYPDQVQLMKEVMLRPEFVDQMFLIVERNSIGLPVMQMMFDKGLSPIGITTTAGKEVNVTKTSYNVPKADLVHSLLAALQMHRLKMPPPSVYPIIQTFTDQLNGFQMKIRKQHVIYGAETEDLHDDLVVAAALGVWWMDQIYGFSPRVVSETKDSNTYPEIE